ncbi:AfsR/SARP family transcriptional regulator [Actinomadura sp. HBU206391]|uniref:AfsR/SARP family transcriptional regulator n=1 Tax=Actinomadura sp. HBU206391 TaxID=2731692 RepID=UPI00164F31C1|nr:tetratricopeptide repeat protein [Actinomadura sp. HBU206391]MBC6456995.1 tetratricopeptide repeat protein [Actinomadura sp. HBU206391]
MRLLTMKDKEAGQTGHSSYMRALVEFRILGPIELWADGRRYDLGTVKERCVLAVLLLTPGQPVSTEKLVSRVWDDNPPPRARDNLYSYISRLRRRFHRISDEIRIDSAQSSSYVLRVDHEIIDREKFRLLRTQARAIAESGDDEHALTLHREAARLWRADPLADLSGGWAIRARQSIEDDLLAATDERITIELRLGHHADLVRELSELTERYPFNEKLVGHLMVALYCCGRQADALRVFHQASHRLREEYATDAAPDLQDLHLRILRGDRTLLPTPRSRPADAQPPNNLPLDLRFLIGRDEEIDELLTTVGPARLPTLGREASPAVIAIDGMPGIGKSVFAVRLAHRLADRYPDGQLYLDLRAHHAQSAVDASTALDMLLRLLGVPAGRIPGNTRDRAALWQAELANRRVLLLLDDAAGHEQIRPLVTGNPQCLALVTSRRRLVGLDNVVTKSLDVLSPTDTATLFTLAAGLGRAMNEQDIARVVRQCGYLPMAVQLVGNRLRHRPAWSVGDLAARLEQDNRRLAEIRAENRELTAAFEESYDGLAPQLRTAFRRLGLHLGSDITAHAAAAAIGSGPREADRMLDDLVEHHLITEPAPGRYRFHDLVRDFARHLAERDDPEAERRRTVGRILDHYLATAERADRLLYPHRRRISVDGPPSSADPAPIDTADQARDWMKSEHDNLLSVADHAAAQGLPRHMALLAQVLAGYLDTSGHWETAGRLHERAATAWRETGERIGVAQALSDLSHVRFRTGQYDDALKYAKSSLEIFRSVSDRRGEADILDHTGLVLWHQSRFREALASGRKALAIRRSTEDRRGEAVCLDHTAIFLAHTGRYREAINHRQRSLDIYAEIGDDPHGQMMALNNAGDLSLRLGRVAVAHDYYNKAAAITSEMGRQHAAIWLSNMGGVYRHTGHHDDALHNYRKALLTYQEIGDRRSEIETLLGIGATFQLMGRDGEALVHHQKALALSEQTADLYGEIQALRGIGETFLNSGRHAAALDRYQRTLELARRIGDPFWEAKALEGMGTALMRTRGHAQARRCWKQALRLYERLGVPEAQDVQSYLHGAVEAPDY